MADYRACQTCRYGMLEERGLYRCHRYPPVNREFPLVQKLEWCGEYMLKRGGHLNQEKEKKP